MAERTGFNVTELQREVIQRAWKDDQFRQELLDNPTQVLSREISKLDPHATFPDGVEIRVVEETPSIFYLVLPNNPAKLADSMSDKDLIDAGVTDSGFDHPSAMETDYSLQSTRRCRCHATWSTLYVYSVTQGQTI